MNRNKNMLKTDSNQNVMSLNSIKININNNQDRFRCIHLLLTPRLTYLHMVLWLVYLNTIEQWNSWLNVKKKRKVIYYISLLGFLFGILLEFYEFLWHRFKTFEIVITINGVIKHITNVLEFELKDTICLWLLQYFMFEPA